MKILKDTFYTAIEKIYIALHTYPTELWLYTDDNKLICARHVVDVNNLHDSKNEWALFNYYEKGFRFSDDVEKFYGEQRGWHWDLKVIEAFSPVGKIRNIWPPLI